MSKVFEKKKKMKEKLHTADHILFTVVNKNFLAQSKAMQFSDEFSRVDYECEQDLRDSKQKIETEVNKVINKAYEVKSYKLPRAEVKKIIDISLVPKSIKQINIYEIVGFNKLACAGPHVKNTKEIGKFKIISIKKNGKDTYSIKYAVEE